MYSVSVKTPNQTYYFSNEVVKPSPAIARQAIRQAGVAKGRVYFFANDPDAVPVIYRVSCNDTTRRIYE